MFNFLKRKTKLKRTEKELLCIGNKDHYIGKDFSIYAPSGYSVTVGKTYKVVDEFILHGEVFYKITCDNGFQTSYHENCFDVKSIERERKLNEILG